MRNTPICENGFLGVALGMAVTGMRPVVEIMFSDFLPSAGDAMVNERTTIQVDLQYRGRTLRVPLWVIPGHPDGAATLHFEMPKLSGVDAALVIEATHGLAKGQLRFQLRAKPRT